jgi:hypothetical protein
MRLPVHIATHDDIDAADYRRCSLERYLTDKWRAGEIDAAELTCYGLSYLARGGTGKAAFSFKRGQKSFSPAWVFVCDARAVLAQTTTPNAYGTKIVTRI